MRILSVEIQDLLSIEKASMEFEDFGLVLVEGWNHDTQRANGAGKTAIFNCLAFALYDKLPRKITKSEILRRGCKTGFAKVSVLCNNEVWTVVRSRPKGVKFFKEGVEQDITQERFESIIRLSYEQFLLTIYTPQANSGELKRFLSSPDSSKKEFLLQLLNLNEFSNAKKVIDELVKGHQAAIDLSSKKIETTRAKISAYEESLIDVDSVTSLIQSLQTSLIPVHQEVLELSNTAKPDLSKYQATESTIKAKMSEIAAAKAERTMRMELLRTLDLNLNLPLEEDKTCKECGTLLKIGDDPAAHAFRHNKLLQQRVELLSKIKDIDAIVDKEQSLSDLSDKIRDRKQQESADYREAQARINELNLFIKNKQLQIDNANLKLKNNTDLLVKIQSLQEAVRTSLEGAANSKKELEIYKTLSSIYSPTGAQAYVLDSIVDSFNEVIQKYVDLLSPNMSYVLNSFKENTSGEVVAKFSETLTKGGQQVSVGSLSGGEEKGLSLCVDFALLEVLETQFGMTLNPIILDEPFDGLDISGREIVIDLLESLTKNRQIFVIDHSSEAKSMFTKVVRVELNNNVSSINVTT